MHKIITLSLFVFVFISCGSDDNEDCMKIITIPQTYFVNNRSFSYDIEQLVPCDTPEPTVAEVLDTPPLLENFSFEVLRFEFTPDTGNNTMRLQFEIRLTNNNNFDVNGIPYMTIRTDDFEVSRVYENAITPCLQLEANSSCTYTYDQEDSLVFGTINTIEFVDLQYFLTN
ncbi:hypothetical protein [Aquimarina spongiae]|uniref:Uncharacterized protein n=1 Tax=Aquimarina spongiae TaxID=570521 RepID=A0A1M6CUG0_9FLAO|nr:hypothetical protein [Aquimarina spongiae]SHI64590.1 hypothetical protein SAMN04488508_102283 [Aquimarina spongiae]